MSDRLREPTAATPREVLACVPNFAEGRDPAVLDALLRAVALPGVLLLDSFRSREANRTILTIAGPPLQVCEAAARAAAVAVERIDLTTQRGAHPRIGALDVLPLVPVRGMHMVACAALARELAVTLWERLRLPSYLYAAAAARADRMELSTIRRGQFEGLREAVRRDAQRRPDVGGPGLHPSAGAVAIGARFPLIEMKMFLAAGQLGQARALARALREQPRVEASAYAAPAQTELLIKIADYRQVGVGAVYRALTDAAAAHGASLAGGELVGLIPEDAFEAGSAWVDALNRHAALTGDRRVEERILERILERCLERCPERCLLSPPGHTP